VLPEHEPGGANEALCGVSISRAVSCSRFARVPIISVGDSQFFDYTLTNDDDLPSGPDGGPLGEYAIRIATVLDGRFVGDAENNGSTSGSNLKVYTTSNTDRANRTLVAAWPG
jgi:hypothetical protein